MRKYLCALLICAALFIMGCGTGTPDAAVSEKVQSGNKTGETAAVSRTVEEKTAEEKEDPAEAAVTDTSETVAAESAEKDPEGEAQAPGKDESAEADGEKDADKAAEKAEAPKKEQAETRDRKKESKEKYANDYIPEGFTPYGNYVLVYDSGYEVKTRLSKAGLTYYYGSEEFLFTLDKDLPDMTREVAHILFNNAGPMDPADTGGEEFPFGEGFMIYISLDDGSYYEVSSASLDLNGRIFARDIFELFRQKWEGAF